MNDGPSGAPATRVQGPTTGPNQEPAGSDGGTWLPPQFAHPRRVDLPYGHHLRPIRASDVDLDMVAVMGSQQRLWSIYGKAWDGPRRP